MVDTSAGASFFIRARWVPLAIVVSVFASHATGQSPGSLNFVSRNGSNVGYCGPLGGPLASHTFATPVATSDTISLVDPGGPTSNSSSTTSTLIATPTSAGLSLVSSGIAMRGALTPQLPFGTYATADARDQWDFTVSATVHYTLNVSLSATSNEAVVSACNYLFVGAAITPDPGTPPPPYSASLSAPGTFTLSLSGTLGPGQYVLSMMARADSVSNSWPFSGSLQNSATLSLQSLAVAAPRNAPPNPLSYTCTLPRLGQTWSGSINPALTGHGFAQPFISFATTQLTLPEGPVLLIDLPVVEIAPPLTGPLASFSIALPPDPGLAGLSISTQAVHFGGAPSFALSNAIDLTLGY